MKKWVLGVLAAAILSGPAMAVDHSNYIHDDFESGPEVTETCLHCHAEEGKEVLESAHWLWKGPSPHVVGLEKGVELGKRDLMNNY
ncbi:MAG: hypothetical protein R6U41_07860 [Desulfosalsimonas sp.]|uniref:hypothetical protein n=1 Tax=Desulfosalsimonas sp. TaxID=3073848 RepID=UPI0039705263